MKSPLTAASTSSALRPRLEALLGRLARGYIGNLGTIERAMVESLLRVRGWDLERLASARGPLAPVSDWALAILVQQFVFDLAGLDPGMVEDAAQGAAPAPANLDAALAELRDAMAR